MITPRTITVLIAGRRRRLAAPPTEALAVLGCLVEPGLLEGIRLRMDGLDAVARLAKLQRGLDLAAGRERVMPSDPESGQLRAAVEALRALVRAALATGEPGLGRRGIDRAMDGITAAELVLAYGTVFALQAEWCATINAAIEAGSKINDLAAAVCLNADQGQEA